MAKQTSYKTEAIILKSYDMRLYDRLYVVFSREKGLMKVVGIGARRPKAKLAPGLEPLTKSELFLVECKKLDKVTGVIIHDQFLEIRKRLEVLVSAKRVFAVLETIAPELESASEIYELLCRFLETHNKQEEVDLQVRGLLQMAMTWKMIGWAGYKPHLFHCVNCGKKLQEDIRHSFIVPEGVVCEKCISLKMHSSQIFVTKDTIKLLRIFLHKNFEVVSKIKVAKESFSQAQKVTKSVVAYVTRRDNLI